MNKENPSADKREKGEKRRTKKKDKNGYFETRQERVRPNLSRVGALAPTRFSEDKSRLCLKNEEAFDFPVTHVMMKGINVHSK